MKTNKQIMTISLVIISLVFFISCKNLTTCKEIEYSETMMLFDISDEVLFSEINDDITSNFSVFMKQTDFANVQECQQVKMSIGTLSGIDELKIQSTSIGVLQKGLSRNEIRKKSNPKNVVQLIKKSLSNYSTMSKDVKYNSSTNILQTVVKSIVGMDDDSENTLLLFSDMIINNKTEKVNFYKEIPKDVGGTIRKLIDPILLNKFKDKIASGMEIKIIVVHKNETENKVNKKEVKAFWVKCFKDLEIEDVQFIDNLTNKILWED